MEKKLDQTNYPFCQWELITDCNMNCKGCQVPQKKVKHPDIAIVLGSVNDLIVAGVKNLEILGGEPLLYEDLPTLLRYLNKRKEIERFSVLTNATLADKLQEIKPELSHTKGGLVVSINYTEEHCRDFIKADIDAAMAKKSLAGWQVLREFGKYCSIRVNCVVNSLNILHLEEIARRVISLGGSFSFCPLIYKRQEYKSGLSFTFRSPSVGFALIGKHKQIVERTMMRLMELKKEHPKKIIPTAEYMRMIIESCKNPNEPYPANCKGAGIPYLRIDSEIGKSIHDGKTSFKLRACSDLKGSEISQLVTSDIRDINIRRKLPSIYQNDQQVKNCCDIEGCVWSVTHILSQKNI